MSAARPNTSITLIWEAQLCEELGRSKFSLDRWIKAGRFPPPINVTQQGRAWRVRDIEAWLDTLARTRKKPKRRGSLMRGDTLVEYSRRATDA